MLCPNCGYLITKKQETCPKCKQPLPEGPGEWSDESSVDRQILDKIIKQPRPPDNAAEVKKDPGQAPPEPPKPKEIIPVEITAPVEKKSSLDENSAPGPLFKKEKPVEPKPEVIEEPKVAVKPVAVEKPEVVSKPVVTVKPEVTPKPEAAFKPAVTTKPMKEAPEVRHEEKPKEAPPIKIEKQEEKRTTPEPYNKADSGKPSSEFSTDWIEKYARTHVSPIPERAGLGVRFWAGLLDWILLVAVGVIVLLAGRLVIMLLGASYSPWELLRILSLPVGGVWIVLAILYFTVFVAATGQTPGATIMDIRVVDATTNRQISTGKSFIRALVYIFSVAVLGVGCWVAIFDHARRTWPDRVVGTKVNPVIKV